MRIDLSSARSSAPSASDADAATPLRALLAVTHAVRSGSDLGPILDTIGRVIADSLGFRTVAINLYRPEWDDFYVVTVHGNEKARDALLGDARPWSGWAPLLAERFHRRGAYVIPHGEFDWDSTEGASYVPECDPREVPDAWHPEDALMVPMRDREGRVLGIISVDEPLDGLRPRDDDLDLLVALAEHATLAVEAAKEAAEAARYSAGLEQLLHVSSALTGAAAAPEILAYVCEGIRAALDFEKVAIHLLDEPTGVLQAVACVGWDLDEPTMTARLRLDEVAKLFDPAFDVAGCFLVPDAAARGRVAPDHGVYRSVLNGSGPHAWNHHWLVVPLFDSGGRVIGVIWADEPRDRLQPPRERLQALRVFANHAAAALTSAAHVEQLRHLADHDPLTDLLNRRAFARMLDAEVARARRFGRQLALVVFDVDGFKQLNDEHGHAAGDHALQQIARTTSGLVRETDSAFRIGGDEFAILLVEADEGAARATVSRLCAALESHADAHVRALTASFGIAVSGGAGCDASDLYRQADAAMYLAKGRASVAVSETGATG